MPRGGVTTVRTHAKFHGVRRSAGVGGKLRCNFLGARLTSQGNLRCAAIARTADRKNGQNVHRHSLDRLPACELNKNLTWANCGSGVVWKLEDPMRGFETREMELAIA